MGVNSRRSEVAAILISLASNPLFSKSAWACACRVRMQSLIVPGDSLGGGAYAAAVLMLMAVFFLRRCTV